MSKWAANKQNNVKVVYKISATTEINKSGDFRVTHQATGNRWSLSTHMVSFVARFVFWAPMYAL